MSGRHFYRYVDVLLDHLKTDPHFQKHTSSSFIVDYQIQKCVTDCGTDYLAISILAKIGGTCVKYSFRVGNNSEYKYFRHELEELSSMMYNDETVITGSASL